MSVGITLEEMLAWNNEASGCWKTHLEANPAVLELPCDIGGTKNVQEFVRHIWGVELRWAERLAGTEPTAKEKLPEGPLGALYDMHKQATEIFKGLLAGTDESWEQPYHLNFDWVPPEQRTVSRRKIGAHMMFHSQRHWAQLATLVRTAGHPSKFRGDLLFSAALK